MARTILDKVLRFRPDFIEHQLAHAMRYPNGRAYNRTVVPARAARDDAGLGRLSRSAPGREDRARRDGWRGSCPPRTTGEDSACYVGAFDCVNRSRLSEDSTPSWAMGSLAAA